ncbi:MAG: endonuclease [Hyphomonas sp.]|jgi:endonuclease/exonuclease/phosphatase family metal-dependent hydrolase|nr:endonuclease [Hyphomonas sp.]|tara:strand:- start:4071 stop:5045 length:975 start_codon:yes stop_codon:yes gene_type:complete
MPSILDNPPSDIASELNGLALALDSSIPAKQPGKNLLIASWNIRSFGSLTRTWTASSNDSPKRDLRGLRTIIDIISRFDVIALQEVVGDLRALRDMMRFLGDDWSFLMTDVTAGDRGNNERMAFVFDRTRVKPSGLAAEIVIPPEWKDDLQPDALVKQFARTPYAVSFKAGEQTFILVTLHVEFGHSSADRIDELRNIARWMREWADRSNRWHQSLLTLGDFNIDRRGDDLWQAFTSTGLTVPDDLHRVPRTIFSDPANPDLDKFYDQIAWFETGSKKQRIEMHYVRGGGFDFLPHVYTNTGLSKASISYRVSDHYPLWAEFQI